jgi:hypothetical protein
VRLPPFSRALLSLATVIFPGGGLNKRGLPSLLLGSTTAIPFYPLEIKGANLSTSTSRFSELVLPGDKCSSQVKGVSLTPCKYGFCLVALSGASKHRNSPGLEPTLESLLESPSKECSMGSGFFFHSPLNIGPMSTEEISGPTSRAPMLGKSHNICEVVWYTRVGHSQQTHPVPFVL